MSRWGSFLQNAVANVESGIDKILADDDGTLKTKTVEKTSTDMSRQSSVNKKNDRLQQRLAKAVVSRNSSRPPPAERLVAGTTSPRASLESTREKSVDLQSSTISVPSNDSLVPTSDSRLAQPEEAGEDRSARNSLEIPRTATPGEPPTSEAQSSESYNPSPRASQDIAREPVDKASRQTDQDSDAEAAAGEDKDATSTSTSHDTDQQETINQCLERIDALQAKLQYLTKEAIEAARNNAQEADAGSVAQKMAEKDERIALLMDEGQKLSQKEMNGLTVIRRLRAKAAEDEKSLASAKKGLESTNREKNALREQLRAADSMRKQNTDSQAALQKAERELGRVRAENESRGKAIARLQEELKSAKNAEASAGAAKYKAMLEAEQRAALELRDDLSSAKVERELSDNRQRVQLQEVQEKLEREKERASVADLEHRRELGALEGRLEAFRERAEEVSSGVAGDSHAKLLRQIETLQGQYSVANENWRGIESSLLARITGLEKDRDDLTKKEADLRRKLRDTASRCRQLDEQVENSNNEIQDLENTVTSQRIKFKETQVELSKAEAQTKKAQEDLQSTKSNLEARLERAEAEKREATLEPPFTIPRTSSPVSPGFRKPANERGANPARRPQSSQLGSNGHPMPLAERPLARKTSQLHFPAFFARKDSLSSIAHVPETPSIASEQHDSFDGRVTPATPERTATVNELLSGSASGAGAGAGPSVQLVERMSAAVRRLESDKAASRDELERVAGQRDAARRQVVELMREVEAKRARDARLGTLEAEIDGLKRRYDATLELLGEKEELVDELRADIADMKTVYRETLEKSMR